MSIRNVRGSILHRREITESSLIVTVYTDLAGKIDLLAKGARRKKSPFLGRLELFSLCYLTYYENPRMGLNILSESDTIDPRGVLRQNVSFFMTACYLVELVNMGTCVASSVKGVFTLLNESLGCISDFPDERIIKRYFELRLLALLGYSLQLKTCGSCQQEQRLMRCFSPGAGGMVCESCAGRYRDTLPVSPGTLAILRYLRGNPLASAYRLRMTPRQAGEAEYILRRGMLYYLERLPRSLAVSSSFRNPQKP